MNTNEKTWWKNPTFLIGAIIVPIFAAIIGALIQNPDFLTRVVSLTSPRPVLNVSEAQIDLIETHTTVPPTSIPTSPTPFTEVEQTIQAQMLAIQTESQQTIEANLTAIATLWTPTPTPDTRKTAEARLTADTAASTTQVVVDQTSTIEAYTDTPTETSTPTPTHRFTSTYTPTQTPTYSLWQRTALFASTPATSNSAWTPVTQEFEGVPMILVPAGCFEMGSDDGNGDEKNGGTVCFDAPFWIDLTEVTQVQFEQFGGEKVNPNQFEGANHPVEQITWFEARDFCENKRGNGVRLPTEPEWEYAARGPDGLVYPWGNEMPPKAIDSQYVIWSETSNNHTADVGVGIRELGASWVGALDMSGNVWEWVSSLYLDYPYIKELAENMQNTNSWRVWRGGAWNMGNPDYLRSNSRQWFESDLVSWRKGLRCARDVDLP